MLNSLTSVIPAQAGIYLELSFKINLKMDSRFHGNDGIVR